MSTTTYLSPKLVALRLGYRSEKTVRRLIAQGRLPAVRLGRTLRIPLDAVERILSAGALPLDPDRAFPGAAAKEEV